MSEPRVSPAQLEILLKGWETFQSLCRSNGESALTIRAWGVGVWSALIGYGYTQEKQELTIVAVVAISIVFIAELMVRQIQYVYIAKSIEIEVSINSVLVGDRLELPERGISTNFEVPTIWDLLRLLGLRRWLIWFPYLLMVVASILLYGFGPQ